MLIWTGVNVYVYVTPVQISIFRIRRLVNADADENVDVHVSRERTFTSLLSIRQARRFFGGRADSGPGRSAAEPWE